MSHAPFLQRDKHDRPRAIATRLGRVRVRNVARVLLRFRAFDALTEAPTVASRIELLRSFDVAAAFADGENHQK